MREYTYDVGVIRIARFLPPCYSMLPSLQSYKSEHLPVHLFSIGQLYRPYRHLSHVCFEKKKNLLTFTRCYISDVVWDTFYGIRDVSSICFKVGHCITKCCMLSLHPKSQRLPVLNICEALLEAMSSRFSILALQAIIL